MHATNPHPIPPTPPTAARIATRSRIRHVAAIALALIAFVWPQVALARTETLRWRHPQDGEVQYFRVHWGLQSGNYSSSVSVGRPSSGSEFRFDAEVPDQALVYFAVSAVGRNGLESPFSNEITRSAGSTTPPTPDPDPDPPGGTSLGRPGRPMIVQ